ncbi:MAG: LemA family protein [Candidatus Omnitrophica bacterium]|jgi:LemA protein|nr:LemA family protein [Candidatus Omnitrophota bacterium]
MQKFLIIVLAVAILCALGIVSIYNSIITKNENVKAKWAQIENQLQRRNDLIPNLVNTVKGYAVHEKNLFTDITRLRTQWAQSTNVDDKLKAAQGMDAALSRLIAVAENYPNLKANQNFLALQDELSGTENRIAVERMRYNQAVKEYNITVRTFPGNLIAKKFGYKPATEYFKAEEKAKLVPEVKF